MNRSNREHESMEKSAIRGSGRGRFRGHGLLVTSALALCLAGGVVACSPPQVNLRQANLTKITTTGFRVVMNFSIFNPNAYSLPLENVGWDLNLFNRPFTRGSVNTNNQIAASATSPVDVPLGIRFSSVSMGVKDFMSGKNIPWGIKGRCNFKTPAGPIYVDFGRQGSWKSPLQGGGIRLGSSQELVEPPPQAAEEDVVHHTTFEIRAPQVAWNTNE